MLNDLQLAMAQVESLPTAADTAGPGTTSDRLKPKQIPRLSPSRIPDPLVTSPANRNGRYHLDIISPVNQNGSFEFDRVIKSGKVLRRTKKKGAWKPSWKSTFLVLRPNLLSVYKNEDETELSASITLSEVTAVARVKKTNTDNVFGIFTPAKNYHFSGYSERDTADWIALIRVEAHTDQDEELELPAPGFYAHDANPGDSESTDMSAEDDSERPGSPEMPPQWAVRGNKSRSSTQTASRKPSNLREYSANEQYTTSQSDFSDAAAAGLSSSIPKNKSILASSLPSQTSKLEPIPSDAPLPQPAYQRSTSQLSLQGVVPTTSSQPSQTDPNRVIRQGYLDLHKTTSGVRQWKSIWAVLRPSGLALYKSNSEYEPIKIIPIHSLIDAAEIDSKSRKRGHCWQVIGEEKTWKFNVDSEADLEGWLGALKSVLVKRSRGLSSGHGLPQSVPTPVISVEGHTATRENSNALLGSAMTQGNLQGHLPNRGLQRNDPGGLDEIVEGIDEVSVGDERR